jgi:hypothetical protein
MTEAREERLCSFYAPVLKADALKNAVLACSVLEEVLEDASDALRVVEEDLEGLPLSLVQRMFLVRGVDIPELDGRALRAEFGHLMTHYRFADEDTGQLKELRGLTSGRSDWRC